MSYPGIAISQAINSARGTTRVEALLNRLSEVENAGPAPATLSPEEAARALKYLTREMRNARRAFEANHRAMHAIDSMLDQVF